jgi:hypothetical protein
MSVFSYGLENHGMLEKHHRLDVEDHGNGCKEIGVGRVDHGIYVRRAELSLSEPGFFGTSPLESLCAHVFSRIRRGDDGAYPLLVESFESVVALDIFHVRAKSAGGAK